MSKDNLPKLVYDAAVDGDAARPALVTRRQSLQRISRFAAATAPAMLVLVSGMNAQACSDEKSSKGEGCKDDGLVDPARHDA